MLGGAVGDLNDPLKLMYMATNNVEGLQDALHGAAAGLSTYNKEQGRFEIVGANLRRAQEMAKTLGVDYKEFAKGAIAANERILAGQELSARGLIMDDKDKEFLTNMSQMKGGEMQITIPQSLMDKFGKDFNDKSEVKLSKLNQDQLRILKENRDELEKMNPEDIAKAQFTEAKNAANYLKSIENEVVKNKKNQLIGRSEYIDKKGDNIDQEGVFPLARIQKTITTLKDNANKDILLGMQNVITSTVDGLFGIINQSVDGILKSTFNLGPNDDKKKITGKLEDFFNSTFKTIGVDEVKRKQEEERMKKYYEQGTGKDQRISANIKITQVGLGENFRIDQNGKSFLDVYNV
jgi:hypothetical protein